MNRSRKTKQATLRFFRKLLFALILIWFVFTFILKIHRVSGNNMYPAIRDGDLILAYRIGNPHINDVVLYKNGKITCTGRIIALPDSEISITDEQSVKISGAEISEQIFYPTEKGSLSYPYHTDSNSYFILNDFRSDLQDSRTCGGISELEGRVIFVLRRRGF